MIRRAGGSGSWGPRGSALPARQPAVGRRRLSLLGHPAAPSGVLGIREPGCGGPRGDAQLARRPKYDDHCLADGGVTPIYMCCIHMSHHM